MGVKVLGCWSAGVRGCCGDGSVFAGTASCTTREGGTATACTGNVTAKFEVV